MEGNGHITHMEFWRVIEERDQRDRDEKKEIWGVIRQGSEALQDLTHSVGDLTRELAEDRAQREEERSTIEKRKDKNANRIFAVALAFIVALIGVSVNEMIQWVGKLINGIALWPGL